MRISKIDKTNFKAGNIQLNNINKEKLYSYKAIKKLADNNNLDITIRKSQDPNKLSFKDFFVIFAKDSDKNLGLSCVITENITSDKETSVKIFNAVINAIESLNNKIRF